MSDRLHAVFHSGTFDTIEKGEWRYGKSAAVWFWLGRDYDASLGEANRIAAAIKAEFPYVNVDKCEPFKVPPHFTNWCAHFNMVMAYINLEDILAKGKGYFMTF